MKRFLTILLALALCLSLCACSNTAKTPGTPLSDSETVLVGEWSGQKYENGGLAYFGNANYHTRFVLLSSGKVLLGCSLSSANDSDSGVQHGTWEVENGYLIMFIKEQFDVSYVFKIVDNRTLELNGSTFSKA